ncbi:MAG TPA: recombinase family protein [Terricaulis sp.]|nr:recombinase family protein [Terricaulis sp.]
MNDAEAATVREIFRRYLGVRSVLDLRDGLVRDGVRSKAWVSRAGRARGGVAFTHGALYHILSSRLYLGEIVHRGKIYPGQHAPFIDLETFEAVQRKLKAGAPPLPGAVSKGANAPLLGRLFDDLGNPMTRAHANKGAKRYYYYVSTACIVRKTTGSLKRVSAPVLERAVIGIVAPLLARGWKPDVPNGARVFDAVRRVVVGAKRIVIDVAEDAIDDEVVLESASITRSEDVRRIEAPLNLMRPRHSRGLLASDPSTSARRVDRALVRAVVMARVWSRSLADGEAASIQALAARENMCPIYTGQILPLAFLAPDLVEAILDGRQPPRLTLSALIDQPLPHAWAAQHAFFSKYGNDLAAAPSASFAE